MRPVYFDCEDQPASPELGINDLRGVLNCSLKINQNTIDTVMCLICDQDHGSKKRSFKCNCHKEDLCEVKFYIATCHQDPDVFVLRQSGFGHIFTVT